MVRSTGPELVSATEVSGLFIIAPAPTLAAAPFF